MSQFVSESECLRICNLPATVHWRRWIRAKIPSQEISTGRIYNRELVRHLAAKIAPVAGTPSQAPQRTAPETRVSAPVDSGVPLANRKAGLLETR